MLALFALFILPAAAVDWAPCGNAIDTGNMPPPYDGFGNCDEASSMGLCEDPALGAVITDGCELACGQCSPEAGTIPAEKCEFTVGIASGAYAEEYSWAIDPGTDDVVLPTQTPYQSNAAYAETAMLAAGDHIFKAEDSYGDGWNGGTFTITNVATGTQVVAQTSFDNGFSLPPLAFSTGACGSDETASLSPGAPRDDDDAAAAPSAVYGEQTVTLHLQIENWSSDISWQVDGGDFSGSNYENGKSYDVSIGPLSTGAHTLSMWDVMGDTWNSFDGSPDVHGSASITDANGNSLMGQTFQPNGMQQQDISFTIPDAAPPSAAGVLPACMNDCTGAPADGTTASVCHWAQAYMPNWDDACFDDCNFTDGPSAALVEVCTALTNAPTFTSYSYGSNPLDGVGTSSFGAAAGILATAESYGSFTVADILTDVLPDAMVEALPAADLLPAANIGGGSEQVDVAASSGSGSGSGSGAAAAPTFDDDWFTVAADSSLLMKSNSQQITTQRTQVSTSTVALGSSALVAFALVALVAYNRMRKSSPMATLPEASEMTLRPLPENAADLI